MEIANDLKKFREQEEMTQAQLAEEVGVSRQTVNAIETGKYDPSLELALKIAKHFKREVEEIFTLEK